MREYDRETASEYETILEMREYETRWKNVIGYEQYEGILKDLQNRQKYFIICEYIRKHEGIRQYQRI